MIVKIGRNKFKVGLNPDGVFGAWLPEEVATPVEKMTDIISFKADGKQVFVHCKSSVIVIIGEHSIEEFDFDTKRIWICNEDTQGAWHHNDLNAKTIPQYLKKYVACMIL